MIGSAALNWAIYAPLPKGDSFWTAPNLLLAPWGGSGGGTEGAAPDSPINEMRWLVMRENMRRFATGDRMLSVFDLERGY